MKLGLRIFFCYLLIFAACVFLPVRGILQALMARYLESVARFIGAATTAGRLYDFGAHPGMVAAVEPGATT